jgi:hypothetical protein
MLKRFRRNLKMKVMKKIQVMKKWMGMLALAVLFTAALTACSQDTTIEDYQVLEAEFNALNDERELTLTAETMFDLQAVEGAIVNITSSQIRADGVDESIDTHNVRDQSGGFVSEVETILTGGTGYADMETMMSFTMYEVLNELEELEDYFDISFDDLSYEDILGGSYTHLQFSGEMWDEIQEENQERTDNWMGIYGAFSEETLESYLSYNDGVFRIEMEGEAIQPYLEAVLEEANLDDLGLLLFSLIMITDIDDSLWADLEDDFASWLSSADLTYATLVIERSNPNEETFHQNIQLYIPGYVSFTVDATIIVGKSTPVSAPEQSLTWDDFEERLEMWLMELFTELMGLLDEELPADNNDDVSDEDDDIDGNNDNGGTTDAPELIGLWAEDGFPEEQFQFNADGTGTFIDGFDDYWNMDFTWEVRDNLLIMTVTFLGETESLEAYFTVSGQTLTLTELETGEEITFTRVN